jgi:hypothetical protein
VRFEQCVESAARTPRYGKGTRPSVRACTSRV